MGKPDYRKVGESMIGSILYKGMLVEFVIDAADFPLVEGHKWHLSSNHYIATTVATAAAAAQDCSGAAAPRKKEVYLQNLLLQPPAGMAVQHISRNGLDNRRCNLRLVEASHLVHANAVTNKKRTTELPPLCGLQPTQIPRHVWYVQANGYHGDRFAIELKSEGYLWKSTSSKKVSLQEKLEQTRAKLAELYELYPYLDPKHDEAAIAALEAGFQAILSGPTTK
jgi:hypothetical protein